MRRVVIRGAIMLLKADELVNSAGGEAPGAEEACTNDTVTGEGKEGVLQVEASSLEVRCSEGEAMDDDERQRKRVEQEGGTAEVKCSEPFVRVAPAVKARRRYAKEGKQVVQPAAPPSSAGAAATSTTAMVGAAALVRQGDQNYQEARYRLPATLVPALPAAVLGNLDPNAREYTPAAAATGLGAVGPSCVPSPPHPHHQHHSPPPHHQNLNVGHPHILPITGAFADHLGPRVQYPGGEMGYPAYAVPPFADVGRGAGYGAAVHTSIASDWDATASSLGVVFPADRPPVLSNPISVNPPCLPLPSPSQYCCPPLDRHPYHHRQHPAVPAFLSSSRRLPSPSSGPKDHTSRALLLSGVPLFLSEPQLREELECWGPVRAMEVDRIHEGFVCVQYYDLRHAREALTDIQGQHVQMQQRFQRNQQQLPWKKRSYGGDGVSGKGLICGNVVWAQYTSPSKNGVADACNQGTLVVFNVAAQVQLEELKSVFQKYGDVKDVREASNKKPHKFVEFFDVRDAAAAWSALNGYELCGLSVKIEFSRSAGQLRKSNKPAQTKSRAQNAVAATATDINIIGGHFNLQPSSYSMPVFGAGNSVGASPGQVVPPSFTQPNPYSWDLEASYAAAGLLSASQPACVWPGSAAPDADPAAFPVQQPWSCLPDENQPDQSPFLAGLCGSPTAMQTGAASLNPPPKTNVVKLGAAKPQRYKAGENINGPRRRRNGFQLSDNSLKADQNQHYVGDHNHVDPQQPREVSVAAREPWYFAKPGFISRHMPRDGNVQYSFDEREAHLNQGSSRTTLMVKNIPNKYSQQMLLSLLDQHCLVCNSRIMDPNEPQSAYDFVYLPIDFKNRCNLGYAFVNFTSALATLKFYKAFHEQAWEEFNSKKICEVAYARLQGRAALEDHFRNSRFACDTDEYLPLVFVPPRNGVQCTAPKVAAAQMATPPAGGGRFTPAPSSKAVAAPHHHHRSTRPVPSSPSSSSSSSSSSPSSSISSPPSSSRPSCSDDCLEKKDTTVSAAAAAVNACMPPVDDLSGLQLVSGDDGLLPSLSSNSSANLPARGDLIETSDDDSGHDNVAGEEDVGLAAFPDASSSVAEAQALAVV